MELADQKEEEDWELEVAAENRNNMRYEYHVAREEWETEECARKERNQKRRIEHQSALEKWSKMQRQVKEEGRSPWGKKPVQKPFEKPMPWPKLADFL